MTTPLVWLDRQVLPAERARVSVYDRAFRSGEGVYETLRVDDGHPFRLDQHVDRARRGAAAMGLTIDASTLRRAVTEVAAANRQQRPGTDGVVRLTISAGEMDPTLPVPGGPAGTPTIVATWHPLAHAPGTPPPPVTAVTVPGARPLPHIKSVSSLPALLALREARERGADQALWIGDDEHVLEAATANVIAVVEGRLISPPADLGLLPGVTLDVVLELAPGLGLTVERRALARRVLLDADEAMLTSAGRGVVPLVAVDRVAIGDGTPGPIWRQLHDAYRAEAAREREEAMDRPATHE